MAAVLGIVLLQAFDTGFDSPSVPVDVGEDTTTLPPLDGGTDTLPTTSSVPTTVAARPPSEVSVLVANGTAILGLAGRNTEILQGAGYQTLQPVDATRALDVTTVQHAEGYEAEARAIALTLGLPASSVQPLNSPPVPDTMGANVVVLLGTDTASPDTTDTTSPE